MESWPGAANNGGAYSTVPTVVILDTHAAIRRLIGRMVQRIGLEPLEAADAADALNLLRRTDLVIVAAVVHLHRSSSEVATVQAMRASNSALRIVLISDFMHKLSGSSRYDRHLRELPKPFTLAQLQKALEPPF
jgi:two-component SAPR family response regulator